MTRVLAIAFVAVPIVIAGSACWGTTVDVGTTDRDAGDARSSIPDTGPPVFGDAKPNPLAQCGASGQIDRYYSAKELTERLLGSWGECPHEGVTPLPCIPPTPHPGIRFSSDGTFVILGAADESTDYVEQPSPCGKGTFKIYALTEGGIADGGVSKYVELDDQAPRNGLEVHLFVEDGLFDIELVEFEKGPERMFLRERGDIDTRGYYLRLTPREK